MTDLPPGWTEVTLGDIAESVKNGIFVSRPGFEPNGVPILRISSVRPGVLNLRDVRYSAKGIRELRDSDALLLPGDLLFTRYNGNIDYVGACAMVPEGIGDLTYPDKLIRVRVNPAFVDPRYIQYSFETARVRSLVRAVARTTAGQAGVSGASLKSIALLLPPLAEQRRIVATLDERLLRLRAAEVGLVQGAGRSVQLKAAVLRSAIAGRLSNFEENAYAAECRRVQMLELRREISGNVRRGRPDPLPVVAGHGLDFPERWAVMSMEELTHPERTISYGILKPGPNLSDGVPYVRVVNMRNDRISSGDLHRTSSEIDDQYSRARLASDDVLISIRGTYGRVVKVTPGLAGANITQDSARLSFLAGVDPNFACIYLRSPQVQRHLTRIARGVAVKGVNISDLREMPFPLPHPSEQIAIVQKVDELLAVQETVAKAVLHSQAKAKSLHRSLLAEAFAGRLVAQDPNDEPASELLARIKAERAATIPKQRTRSRRTPKELAAPPTRVTGDDYQQETLPL
ncbi:restriction endonuclease subunit S [Micromonospora matsumotoense]|nr:restriction endonuclease subunit S [Micromonospora matsumotoense]